MESWQTLPVEAHLFLNHFPIVGLIFGVTFLAIGLRKRSPTALTTSLRIFLVIGIIALPVAGSGLVSAWILGDETWLDPGAVSIHRLAGIVTVTVTTCLATVSGVSLFRRAVPDGSVRYRKLVLTLAVAALGSSLFTAYSGGSIRHEELGRSSRSRGMTILIGTMPFP